MRAGRQIAAELDPLRHFRNAAGVIEEKKAHSVVIGSLVADYCLHRLCHIPRIEISRATPKSTATQTVMINSSLTLNCCRGIESGSY